MHLHTNIRFIIIIIIIIIILEQYESNLNLIYNFQC